MKRFSSFLMALLLTLQVLFSTNMAIASDVVPQNETIVIDEELAKKDAKIHRTDGIGLSDVELSTVEKPTKKEYQKNNAPNRIVTTFKNDTKTTRAFNWFTSDNLESYVWVSTNADMSNPQAFSAVSSAVKSHYVERDQDGYFLFQLINQETNEVVRYFTDEGRVAGEWDHTFEIKDKDTEKVGIDVDKITEYSYKAEATGLTPDTVYYYQVGSESGGKSEIGTFKTSSTKEKAFTFLHYTDTQNAYWNQNLIDEAAYGADTIKRALETAPEADFVIHTGDIVEIAEVEDEWVDLFEKSKESFLKTTIAPVSGNHDEYALNYNERMLNKFNDHFNVPAEGPIDGGSYYSFDYNGVHFVVLNSNDNKNEAVKALGEEQLAWMEKDIKEARANGAKWVVLNYHKPIYSKSYHSLQDTDVQNVKDEFMALIDKLDVDIALQGHDHVMSRTKSLSYVPKEESVFNAKIADTPETIDGIETLVNPVGTTFVLPNTGGTKAYDDIYSKGLEHIKKVRPRLNWLTEDLVKEYNNLFAYGEQPQKSERFNNSHSNFRDSTVQNFAKYIVDGNSLKTELYQIEGNLGSRRTVKMIDSFSIVKNDEDAIPSIRYSGDDRYATSVEVSKNNYDKSDNVILVSGEVFADSLAAASLSKLYGAPILLTTEKSIPASVVNEIKRLNAKNVIVVGGEKSVSETAVLQLKDMKVERISGSDRYETALEVANAVIKSSSVNSLILVSGDNSKFADALSAGAPSFIKNAPIVFGSASQNDNLIKFIKESQVEEVVIIGGKNSVSTELENEIKDSVKTVKRVAGDDRYKTALKVYEEYTPQETEIILASGEIFADALVASGILNNKIMPIILTNSNNSIKDVNNFLKEKSINKITIVGGENTVGRVR